MAFYNWFLHPEEGNIFKRMWHRYWNKRMRNLFTCKICGKGDVVNKKGYFECPVCGHEYK